MTNNHVAHWSWSCIHISTTYLLFALLNSYPIIGSCRNCLEVIHLYNLFVGDDEAVRGENFSSASEPSKIGYLVYEACTNDQILSRSSSGILLVSL